MYKGKSTFLISTQHICTKYYLSSPNLIFLLLILSFLDPYLVNGIRISTKVSKSINSFVKNSFVYFLKSKGMLSSFSTRVEGDCLKRLVLYFLKNIPVNTFLLFFSSILAGLFSWLISLPVFSLYSWSIFRAYISLFL